MREFFIWNVRLERGYNFTERFLTSTDEVAEAMVYADAWAKEISKDESREVKVSTLECEGTVLVPDGLELTGSGE